MTVEDFSVSSIEWLRDSHFDEKVFGKPGKLFLYVGAALLWIYIVSWIYKDAEHKYFEGSRAKYIWLVVAVFAAPVAWFVYLILRPSSDLDESYLQRVEERYLAFEARGLGYCAKCKAPVDPDYVFCISCGARVRSKCQECKKLVETDSQYCPNCGAKQPGKTKITVIRLDESDVTPPVAETKAEKGGGKQEPFFDKVGEYFSKATSSFTTAFLPKKDEPQNGGKDNNAPEKTANQKPQKAEKKKGKSSDKVL